MKRFSPYRRDALAVGQQIFRVANNHPSTIEFKKTMIEDFLFYEGDQWLPEDKRILEEREQPILVANITQLYIDALSGVEIMGRHRAAAGSNSSDQEEVDKANAVSHILYAIQEYNSQPFKCSLKFRDALICGIGWSYQYKKDNALVYDYIHPSLIYYDPDDSSPQLTNMKYVIRKWFLSLDEIKANWPKYTGHINLKDELDNDSPVTAEIQDREANYTSYSDYNSGANSTYLVVEVQYKVEAKAYCGTDRNGRYFETFEEDDAYELVDSKKDINVINAKRIMRVVFFDDLLLEFGPLDPDLPNRTDFSYIPYIWKRKYKSFVPIGLTHSIKSIARDCNSRLSTANYLLNSTQVTFEGDVSPLAGMDLETLRAESKRRDGVIVFPKGSNGKIVSNSQYALDQTHILKFSLELVQKMLGITDEQLGFQTNATSGVAQEKRMFAGVRNNIFGFDALSEIKKREAQYFLEMILYTNELNIIAEISTPEQKQTLLLNREYKAKDGTVILNNIRNLRFNLYIEEVPNYRSSAEENKAIWESLLNNQNAQLIMQNSEVMKEMGVRNSDKVAQIMRQAMIDKFMIENGQMPGMQGPQMQQDSNGQMPGMQGQQMQQQMPVDQLNY